MERFFCSGGFTVCAANNVFGCVGFVSKVNKAFYRNAPDEFSVAVLSKFVFGSLASGASDAVSGSLGFYCLQRCIQEATS